MSSEEAHDKAKVDEQTRNNDTLPTRSPTLNGKTPDLNNEKLESGSKEISQENIAPPDGGLTAWLVVVGTVCVSFATFGIVNAYGAFSDFYKTVYLSNYSATVVTMVGSLQVFMLYIFAGLSGAVFDAKGPRIMVPLSGVIVVFALFMLSITKPQQIWQQFLTQSILFNLGASFAFFPSIAILAHWFTKKLPVAVGCLTAGASGGGIVLPIMLDKLIPKVGWGWTVRIIAFISLALFVIATVTIKARRPTKPLPKLSTLLAFEAFKNPVYTVFAVGCWFTIFSVFSPFFYVGLMAKTTNPGSSINPYYLAILCATSIPGRVFPGFVASRWGAYNVMMFSTLLSSVLILALWYPSTQEPNLLAFAALYGFASGPFFSLNPPCVAKIVPIERVGASIGMLFAFMSTGALTGTPIGGVFIKVLTVENFKHEILFAGIMGLVGSALIFVARFMLQPKLFAVV